MSTAMLPDLNLLPSEALKALVLAQHEQLLWRESEIEHLKLLIAKLQRLQFGRKSEKLSTSLLRGHLGCPKHLSTRSTSDAYLSDASLCFETCVIMRADN